MSEMWRYGTAGYFGMPRLLYANVRQTLRSAVPHRCGGLPGEPLCTQAGCAHNSPACGAYRNYADERSSFVVPVNGKLYEAYLSHDGTGAKIVEMTLEGGNPQTVYTFAEDEFLFGGYLEIYAYDSENIYFFYQKGISDIGPRFLRPMR